MVSCSIGGAAGAAVTYEVALHTDRFTVADVSRCCPFPSFCDASPSAARVCMTGSQQVCTER